MRLLLVICVLAVSVSAQSPPHRIKKQGPATEQNQRGESKPQPSPPPDTVADDSNKEATHQPQSNQEQAPADNVTRDPGSDAEWAMFWVTLFGIVLGLGTLIVLICQTRATADAARVAKHSARAAWLNAKAIVNAERPWIVPSLERDVLVPGMRIRDSSGAAKVAAHPDVEFQLVLKNVGRTPAHILSVVAAQAFTQRGEDLPDIPKFGPEPPFNQQRILSPGEPMTLEPWAFQSRVVLMDGKWDQVIVEPTRWWWFYGRARYKNVLDGREHETRFCYLYIPDLSDFVIAGPPDYTKYT